MLAPRPEIISCTVISFLVQYDALAALILFVFLALSTLFFVCFALGSEEMFIAEDAGSSSRFAMLMILFLDLILWLLLLLSAICADAVNTIECANASVSMLMFILSDFNFMMKWCEDSRLEVTEITIK